MFSEIPFLGFSFLGRHGISTFSILLLISFLSVAAIIRRDLARKGLRHELTDSLILIAIISSIVGSKVFFAWEVWDRIWIIDLGFWDTFRRVFFTWSGMSHLGGIGLWATLFSGGGLVFYGGFIFTFISLYSYIRWHKLEIWKYSDTICLGLALGYGIGRIGCFVSGDGCFGHSAPIDLPIFTWVFGPENGICPTDPSLKWKYPLICTYGLRVWNTPIMEAVVSFTFFAIIMTKIRYMNFRPGMITALAFIVNGSARFLVEFIRVNDALIPILDPPSIEIDGRKIILKHFAQHLDFHSLLANTTTNEKLFYEHWHWYGITQSQLIALIIVIIAVIWIFRSKLYLRQDTLNINQTK